MAAKINKFRKVVKKAGEFVAPTSFDLEEYAETDENGDPVGDKAFVERREEYVGRKFARRI